MSVAFWSVLAPLNAMRHISDPHTATDLGRRDVGDKVPPRPVNVSFEEAVLSREDFALYDAIAVLAKRKINAIEELFTDYR